MNNEDDRSTKAVVMYMAILDVITKIREEAEWEDDETTILAAIDALSNHLCVMTKFIHLTIDEVKFSVERMWNELKDIDIKDNDPLADIIGTNNTGEAN